MNRSPTPSWPPAGGGVGWGGRGGAGLGGSGEGRDQHSLSLMTDAFLMVWRILGCSLHEQLRSPGKFSPARPLSRAESNAGCRLERLGFWLRPMSRVVRRPECFEEHVRLLAPKKRGAAGFVGEGGARDAPRPERPREQDHGKTTGTEKTKIKVAPGNPGGIPLIMMQ